jgi:hypothetical protein
MLGVQKLNSAAERIQRNRVNVTTRYTHTNLDSKHAAAVRLEELGDSLHQNAATKEELLPREAVSYNVSAG